MSTYGASKLAGEALIASYASMFGLSGCAFRFGNVVGPRQTHGVGFDFVRRLLRSDPASRAAHPGRRPAEQVVHPRDDVVRAVLTAHDDDADAVRALQRRDRRLHHGRREIAELAVECVGLPPASVRFEYTGGDRGWKGDVPIVRLDTDRIRAWAGAAACRRARRCASRSCRCCRICGRGECR